MTPQPTNPQPPKKMKNYELHNENGLIAESTEISTILDCLAEEMGKHESLTLYDWTRADETCGDAYAGIVEWDKTNGLSTTWITGETSELKNKVETTLREHIKS
jgi:hypothetical protein